ncbi:MAG: hypothetical protein V7636_1554 [Actinomycetota bacterium]
MAVAAISAIVAAVIPTHAVADLSVALPARPSIFDKPSVGGVVPLDIAGHHVTVTAPAGYFVVQIGAGDASHAHVTVAPSEGPGQTMTVRFAVPDGIKLGAIVGVHQGTAVRETRFGTLWRSPYGIVVLVTGDSPAAQLSAIDGVRIDP